MTAAAIKAIASTTLRSVGVHVCATSLIKGIRGDDFAKPALAGVACVVVAAVLAAAK